MWIGKAPQQLDYPCRQTIYQKTMPTALSSKDQLPNVYDITVF